MSKTVDRSVPAGKKRINLNPIRIYQNLPIRYKLMLVLNLLMISSLAVLTFLNYKNSESSLTKKSTQYTQDLLKMMEYRLKDYVVNLDLITLGLLPDNDVLLDVSELSDSLKIYEDAYLIENHMKKEIFPRDEIQSAAFITTNGSYFAVDKSNKTISIKQLMPYNGEIYKKVLAKARESKGSPVFYLDTMNGRAENLFLARMVYNIHDYREIGLIAMLLGKDYLKTALEDMVNEDTENIIIFSPDNDIIVDKNEVTDAELTEKLARIDDNSGWFIDEGRHCIVSYLIMNDKPNWKIISTVSLDSLYKDIDSLRKKMVLSSLAIVVLLSTLSSLMTTDFTRPFKKLIRGMEKVQNGDHNVQIVLNRKDEIGYLGEAFNRMVKEMKNLTNWVYQEQLTRKDAEIKALQSQINPHFLFNTLDSINWMAHLNNVPEISEMVTSLSAIMEASIGRDDKLISFSEELNYIDNYVKILNKRYANRIQLIKEIEPEVLDIKIPRLLIQPLIENAIYHGLEKDKEVGIIIITAKIIDDKVMISVMDNGEGIGEKELKLINESLSLDNETYYKSLNTGKRKGIGLDNVNRRIKLFYGDEYGLTIESKKNMYTKVYFSIPLTPVTNPSEGGDQAV